MNNNGTNINSVLRLVTFTLIVLLSFPALAGLFSNDLGFGNQKREFLPADEAFIVSLETAAQDQVNINFNIKDGYYLYKDKFKFRLHDEKVSIKNVVLPKGDEKDDPLFGKVEVYHGAVTIPVQFARSSSQPLEIEIEVAYQGCAEDGICYPPMKKLLPLTLAAAETTNSSEPVNPFNSNQLQQTTGLKNKTTLSESDSIAATLANKSLLLNLLAFLGFGLALSLTPCVYPMIPILSGILVGQGVKTTARKSFMLSLAYVLGMAVTYAIVGVVAGIFGQNLQAVFQNPWIIAIFAGVFVLLALSMFGFYDIQMPSAIQTRLNKLSHGQERGTLVGAAIMGILSAVIVGPCVAAPLAGALIYIGQTGNGLLGGLALFTMGLGMGIPLLLIGASAGSLLPRAGVWMNTIKHIFGVLMLAVAIWLLDRILPLSVTMFLWGLLLIGSAVYMRAFDTLTDVSTGWQRLWKALGLVMTLYGSLLIIGAAAGSNDLFQPLKTLAGSGYPKNDQTLEFIPVKGVVGLDSILQTAKAQNKPVMLDFYADWCIECKRLEKNTFADPEVKRLLKNVILAQADVTPNDKADQALLRSLELIGPPAILFFSPDGKEMRKFRVSGYFDPESFKHHLRNVLGS